MINNVKILEEFKNKKKTKKDKKESRILKVSLNEKMVLCMLKNHMEFNELSDDELLELTSMLVDILINFNILSVNEDFIESFIKFNESKYSDMFDFEEFLEEAITKAYIVSFKATETFAKMSDDILESLKNI
ncbi:MAG: hypothetical protein ACRDBY_07975, partial [Cetobacterium sp.]